MGGVEGAAQGRTLESVLIDDLTWRGGSRARRLEWQQAIGDLVADGCFTGGALVAPPLRAYVTVHREGMAVALHEPDGRQAAHAELSQAVLRPLLHDYMQIVRDMVRAEQGQNSPQIEALDIAKRLAHDDGAEAVLRHFQPLRPSHETARRLFTLFVVLSYDTTRILELRS